MTTFHIVPAHSVAPSDEMVEWLHMMEQEWEGDECGVLVWPPGVADADPDLASPGDAVVEHGGVYRVYKRPDHHTLCAAAENDCWPEEVTKDQRREPQQ